MYIMNIFITDFYHRSDLLDKAEAMIANHWPAFMMGTSVDDSYWERLYDVPFSHYQFMAVLKTQTEEKVIGVINSIALPWQTNSLNDLPDEGWDRVFQLGMEAEEQQLPCHLISALSVTIDHHYRGKGIAQRLINTLKEHAKKQGYLGVAVPVRPTLKHCYPFHSFAEYCQWKNDNDEPFDPWIRTHWRLGATTIKIAPQSMKIEAPTEKWQQWTSLRFPVSGDYTIPMGLAPLNIDIQRQYGVYLEPNLWMFHRIR
ncbi:transferase [Proteus mirabilis]|nr:transferase [Proteus mirabilis]EKT9734179.1 GNAT family N-acetyltransferase [Proteus mirabilis]EKW6743439.1 GNAT family N-acetyltransferase [Proteus mirabilis]ELB1101990.1 GNAT family N-acetyltransferase [Proteus mirabilis]MBI6370087.1 GNAT family N-acetyltransferase [Proteus mirabilis]